MLDMRGKLEVETLLKVVLGLIAVLLVIEVLEAILGTLASVFGLFVPIIQLAIGVLIVLWLLDQL
ncbi:DUF7554 family protein [Natrinema versiforme]|uniref:Uncharacterized protein n=1 Tax=Natrinema versiforme JCM 10478 TaxID=1227496 RepID=L9XUK8_9EURY|nr:hypothetical protein [Natrinema versiforme]ELY65232.1 hypothetical protein C489_15667 [Natrinema versiforme JCM 10478]